MDSTDVHISQMLLTNSRTPYRDIAERLNLSVNAVHKRVQSLIEEKVIREFTARPGFAATGAVIAVIHGRSDKRPEILREKLGENKNIYWLCAASGGYLYIGVYLRSLNDLRPMLEYVQDNTGIADPKTTIMAEIPKIPDALDELDLGIIQSLSSDSRKPVAEVAEELGASVKTVKRRLEAMIRNGTIDLSINWYPDASNDIVSITHVVSAQGSKLSNTTMLKEYDPEIVMVFQSINAPRELLCVTWSPTMKDLKALIERVRSDERVEVATPNILYMGWIFPTWRNEYAATVRSP